MCSLEMRGTWEDNLDSSVNGDLEIVRCATRWYCTIVFACRAIEPYSEWRTSTW